MSHDATRTSKVSNIR